MTDVKQYRRTGSLNKTSVDPQYLSDKRSNLDISNNELEKWFIKLFGSPGLGENHKGATNGAFKNALLKATQKLSMYAPIKGEFGNDKNRLYNELKTHAMATANDILNKSKNGGFIVNDAKVKVDKDTGERIEEDDIKTEIPKGSYVLYDPSEILSDNYDEETGKWAEQNTPEFIMNRNLAYRSIQYAVNSLFNQYTGDWPSNYIKYGPRGGTHGSTSRHDFMTHGESMSRFDSADFEGGVEDHGVADVSGDYEIDDMDEENMTTKYDEIDYAVDDENEMIDDTSDDNVDYGTTEQETTSRRKSKSNRLKALITKRQRMFDEDIKLPTHDEIEEKLSLFLDRNYTLDELDILDDPEAPEEAKKEILTNRANEDERIYKKQMSNIYREALGARFWDSLSQEDKEVFLNAEPEAVEELAEDSHKPSSAVIDKYLSQIPNARPFTEEEKNKLNDPTISKYTKMLIKKDAMGKSEEQYKKLMSNIFRQALGEDVWDYAGDDKDKLLSFDRDAMVDYFSDLDIMGDSGKIATGVQEVLGEKYFPANVSNPSASFGALLDKIQKKTGAAIKPSDVSGDEKKIEEMKREQKAKKERDSEVEQKIGLAERLINKVDSIPEGADITKYFKTKYTAQRERLEKAIDVLKDLGLLNEDNTTIPKADRKSLREYLEMVTEMDKLPEPVSAPEPKVESKPETKPEIASKPEQPVQQNKPKDIESTKREFISLTKDNPKSWKKMDDEALDELEDAGIIEWVDSERTYRLLEDKAEDKITTMKKQFIEATKENHKNWKSLDDEMLDELEDAGIIEWVDSERTYKLL